MKYILKNDNLEVVGKQYLDGVGNYKGDTTNASDLATVVNNKADKSELDKANKLISDNSEVVAAAITAIDEKYRNLNLKTDLIEQENKVAAQDLTALDRRLTKIEEGADGGDAVMQLANRMTTLENDIRTNITVANAEKIAGQRLHHQPPLQS